jgi:hypothetical protein
MCDKATANCSCVMFWFRKDGYQNHRPSPWTRRFSYTNSLAVRLISERQCS